MKSELLFAIGQEKSRVTAHSLFNSGINKVAMLKNGLQLMSLKQNSSSNCIILHHVIVYYGLMKAKVSFTHGTTYTELLCSVIGK